MDAIRRTFSQYRDLFRSLTPSQRGTLIVIPLMVAAAMGFLLLNGRSSSYVALSWGKTFTTEELASAEQSLIDAGLSDFRREGRRLMVPRNEVDRYNAALLEGGTLPQGWGDELEKQLLENSSPFRTQQQTEAGRDVALSRALKRMMEALPDIEWADAKWATSNAGRRSFRRDSKVTATVWVKPRNGREISQRLVQSLRAAVAGMIPDLNSADVTVFDVAAQVAHTPESEDDALDSRVLARIRQFEHDYESKISKALSYANALVTVHVDLDNLKHSITRERSVDPKKFVTLQETTRRDDEKLIQQSPRSEPGAVPNQPRNLAPAAGPQQQRTSTADTASSVSLPWVQLREEEMLGAMPKAVQVSVQIPEDYYEAIAIKRGLVRGDTDADKAAFRKSVDDIRTQEEARARQTAATLIPASSPAEAVHVSSYVSIEVAEEPVEVSTLDTVSQIAAEWWSAAALGLFALFALWMLKKTMPRLPEAPAEPSLPEFFQPPIAPIAAAGDVPPDLPHELTKRDRIQTIVRDNPEMTASLLSRWIEAAR
jgi:flagellar M-ring protein FliF